ncbi:unnamed protein product, partial [Polarella glacialis]
VSCPDQILEQMEGIPIVQLPAVPSLPPSLPSEVKPSQDSPQRSEAFRLVFRVVPAVCGVLCITCICFCVRLLADQQFQQSQIDRLQADVRRLFEDSSSYAGTITLGRQAGRQRRAQSLTRPWSPWSPESPWSPPRYYHSHDAEPATATATTSGMISLATAGVTANAQTFDMSSAACDNSAPCPPNFIAHTLTADLTLTVSQCSDALIGSAAFVTQVMEFTFINADDDMTLIITDGTGTYKLAPYESVTAHCWSGGGDRLYFPEMSGSIGFCSAGCDAAAPTDRSGTAFGTTQNLIVATAALAETHVSKWETLSGSSGTCPRGCDVAAPQYESTTPNTFSVTQNLVVATAALAETHVSKWETLSGSAAGTCPRGCDVVTPLYESGSSFFVTQNLVVVTAALAESWQLASGSGGYCPRCSMLLLHYMCRGPLSE